jgi:transcriptional regulator with XRE-family HTH domain
MVRLEPGYLIAVQADLADQAREEEGSTMLTRLRAELDLSFDDLGRVLGVTGETVRRWERGLAPIPPERLAVIAEQGAALERLKVFLRAERLPVSTRRKARLFDGETARDFILRGRMAEVVERYDRALRYQA